MSRRSIGASCLGFITVLAIIVGSGDVSSVSGQQPPAKKQPPDAKKAAEAKKTPEVKKAETKKPTEPKSEEKAPPDPVGNEPPPPLEGATSPLELVRGLRNNGMAELAMEYLRDLEAKPLPAEIKSELPLERSKTQLEAADEEADEGTRASLVADAREGFERFLKDSPQHPRAPEAYLALARLTALDAKAQLSKARRAEIPPRPDESDAAAFRRYEQAIQAQRADAAAARPLFIAAAEKFKAAADLIEAQLKKETKDKALIRNLEQALIDARISAGTTQFALADTYLNSSAAEKKERSELIDKARVSFATIEKGRQVPARVSWLSRAWISECEMEKDNLRIGQEEADRILKSNSPDAEDGKRMVKFFQIRRKFIAGVSGSLKDLEAAESESRAWLQLYSNVRRAQAEIPAVRWYQGYSAQIQGDLKLPPPPKVASKTPAPPPTIPDFSRAKYTEAEKLYRIISQTDNEYTQRAARARMTVVRRLLGDADKPASEYKTFEACQMASLILMSKLIDDKKLGAAREKILEREQAIVNLLERARSLATDKDNPADVNEVLLRLIYFYRETDQPYHEAVLGEYVAHHIKSTGGKAAVAGALGLDGFVTASGQVRLTDPDLLDAARKSDRERAIKLARFLDEKYPNDTATDRARYRLGSLLYDDGKVVEAFEMLLKIRPGYEQIAQVRMFEGFLAILLLSPKDSVLPPERRLEVFRRTAADIEKLPRPASEATEDEARAYLSARWRLAQLYLNQPKVDPDGERADPGYPKARKIAEEMEKAVQSYSVFVKEDAGTKTLTIEGWEMKLLAEDARVKAAYLEGQSQFIKKNYEGAYAAIGPILAEMKDGKPYRDILKPLTEVGKKNAVAKKDDKNKDEIDEEMSVDASSALKTKVKKFADGVDKLRQELIVLALKVRVKQGEADKGVEQLELLKQFGGSIEANVSTLQLLTNEMAVQILVLRKEGKADEAKAMTEGFAKLLDRLSAEPKLPRSMQLFLGQSLVLVGDYTKAEELLKKVPTPKAEQLAKPIAGLEGDERRLVVEYRRSILELVRCYRAAKKYAECEAALNAAMGTKEKQSWAYSSMDFRKEYAYLFEARGGEEADTKKSNDLWSKAVQEWSLQANLARKRIETVPKNADGTPDNAGHLRAKNAFFEAFFDYNRCILKANLHLLRTPPGSPPNPKLQRTFDDVGKKFADMEKANWSDMAPEVRAKYAELLQEMPELRKSYSAAGGNQFLEKPGAGNTAGGM